MTFTRVRPLRALLGSDRSCGTEQPQLHWCLWIDTPEGQGTTTQGHPVGIQILTGSLGGSDKYPIAQADGEGRWGSDSSYPQGVGEHLPENREEEEGEREQKRGKGDKGRGEKRGGKREGARKKKGHLIPKFGKAGVYSSGALASWENQPLSWL